jgi:hypothetical protein
LLLVQVVILLDHAPMGVAALLIQLPLLPTAVETELAARKAA